MCINCIYHYYVIFSVPSSFLDISLPLFIIGQVADSGYVFADKPEIDTSPQISKAASNTGDTGRLVCRASGAPKLRFTWSRDGATIPVNTTEKYYTNFHQVCSKSCTSELQIVVQFVFLLLHHQLQAMISLAHSVPIGVAVDLTITFLVLPNFFYLV